MTRINIYLIEHDQEMCKTGVSALMQIVSPQHTPSYPGNIPLPFMFVMINETP